MKFWIIAKKEILDITRDRRTMLMMVVLPLLLVPVLLGTVMKIDSFQKEKASEKLEFEKAAEIRDRLKRLQLLREEPVLVTQLNIMKSINL